MRASRVKPELLRRFISDNSGTINDYSTRDAWLHYLQQQTGASGTVEELEPIYVRSLGGAGETINDLWENYLDKVPGLSEGTADRFRQLMTNGVISPQV